MELLDRSSYEHLLAQARRLEPEDQARLLDALASLVQRPPSGARYRISALRGLGREVWRGVDAQEYVRRGRATWDG